jgi:hypothetical protein
MISVHVLIFTSDGPSLIIAWAPCTNHGLNMEQSQKEEEGDQEGYEGKIRALQTHGGPRRGLTDFVIDNLLKFIIFNTFKSI